MCIRNDNYFIAAVLPRVARHPSLHNEGVQAQSPTRHLLALCLTAGLAQAQNKGQQLPEGQGKATTQKICSGCHAPEIVLGKHETKERWVQIVTDMVNKGANGTDDEFNEVINYLAAHFPPQTR
jgi:mono/diheme cytochrome c family protein